MDHCDVQDGQAAIYNDGSTINWGAGNIGELPEHDPLFVDALAGDLHLWSGSPCVDAGDPNLVAGTARQANAARPG